MSSVKYQGGELDSVRLASGAMTVNTDTGQRDAAFSDCAISLNGNSYYTDLRNPDGSLSSIPVTSTAWVHFYTALEVGVGYTGNTLTTYDVNGRPSVRMNRTSNSPWSFQENTSANATPNWVTLFSYSAPTGIYIDLEIKQNLLRLYVNGDMVNSAPLTATRAAMLNVLWGSANTNGVNVSQIIITENKSTVGARLFTRKASGAGTFSGMTGTYSNLVKMSINDLTAVTSDTVGQTSTFAYQDVTVPSGLVMADVWVWNRVRNDGSEPTSMKQVVLIGGTQYKSGDLAITGGYSAQPSIWPTSPTGVNWTSTLFNGAEIGMESTTP